MYRSVFESAPHFSKKTPPLYFPLESFARLPQADGGELLADLDSMNAWDVATRYHEFKSKRAMTQDKIKQLRRQSAQAILQRAQRVLGAVVHPMNQKSAPWSEIPPDAEQVDFDLEETIESSPIAMASVTLGSGEELWNYPVLDQDIWMSFAVPRRQVIVLMVDTSLSMTGEKLALTAVALAVVLLEFPNDPIGIVAFENEAKLVKYPYEKLSVELLLERFLDVPTQGYTHLEEGMKMGLQVLRSVQLSGSGRPPFSILLTDGKYTAGKDPAYLAPRYSHLVVLKIGKEKAGYELCKELAQLGGGSLREVDDLEGLPSIMYGVVKDLLR